MLRAGGRSRLLAPGLRRLLGPAAAAGERAAPALATAKANQRVVDACSKSFGCGSSAIASSSSVGLSKQTAIGGLREAFLKSGDAAHASSIKNSRWYMIHSNSSGSLTARKECHKVLPSSIRPCASYSTKASENKPKQERIDLQTIEDPFDAPTYNIPEKPVTFAEGASYSVVILAGLGVAALAGYAVFKELIFEPKEYKMFGKALARVQSDSQVTAKIGYPITGYGTESRNRAARQRIQNRVWTDEDGVEHVEVGFHIRGPHGAGKVFAEMFKDSSDRQWKFTFLLVEITSPRHAQIMLESYIPA